MDGTATINAKVDSLRLCGFVQNLGCAKPRLWKYLGTSSTWAHAGCRVTCGLVRLAAPPSPNNESAAAHSPTLLTAR